jgi:lipoprotein-anchoring transpeptidase ErfK/SrfK
MPTRRLSLLAALCAAVIAMTACTSGGAAPSITKTVTGPNAASDAAPSTGAASSAAASSATPTPTPTPTKPPTVVHVTALESDGSTYGVGLPIVLFFTPLPTESKAFTKAVKVTVNGQPAAGAWYWEQPTADEVSSHTYEAHYRLQNYWPAHSHIHVDIPIGGLSAGKGLVYDNKLTSLDFQIGARHVSTINCNTKRMQVTSDNKLVKTLPVSCGAARTPTFHGTKVVMQKGEQAPDSSTLRPAGAVRMVGPGYNEIVDWSVRITRSGEYIHAAPWNSNIGRMSTSNGCTNLFTADAKWFYGFAVVGDVANYPVTNGPQMPSWDGFGDWNLSWGQWSQGGLLVNL